MQENQSLTRQRWFDLVKEHKASGCLLYTSPSPRD